MRAAASSTGYDNVVVELRRAREGVDDRDTAEEESDVNELSVDSLPSELATGRTGVDELLESMFTERTEDTTRADSEAKSEDDDAQGECEHGGDEDQEEQGLCEAQDGRQSPTQGEVFTSLNPTNDQEDDCEHSGDELLLVDPANETEHAYDEVRVVTQAQSSPTCQRSLPAPDHPSLPQSSPKPSFHPPVMRIVAFDVGGKLFRCKESLIRKFPRKRLNQVITCGCEKIGHDTFFIDRNPQHFEVILDWYRTGTYVRHPHVTEHALIEDAKYFDLFEELFPDKAVQQQAASHADHTVASSTSPPRIPPRPHRLDSSQPQTHSVKPTNRFEPVNSSNQSSPDTMRFCKTEYRSVQAEGAPVVYMIRQHEHLLVASVKGRGKLLVRVCDATGLKEIQVENAVLFDSQSCFYLQGGRAKLQHCLLPGAHTYTFWMELGVGDMNATMHELDVEFKLLSTFQGDEQLTDSLDEELQSLECGGAAVDAFPVAQPTSVSRNERAVSYSPYMLLPPRYVQHQQPAPIEHQQPQQVPDPGSNQRGSDRDAVAKQLFLQPGVSSTHKTSPKAPSALSPPGKSAKKTAAAVEGTNSAQKAQASSLKRNGVAIVTSGAKGKQTEAGKITIYQHAQLRIEQTPREAQALSLRESKKQQQGGVATKYQDHQPRLFR